MQIYKYTISIESFGTFLLLLVIPMNEKIKVSLPLAYGEVQAAHDILKLLAENGDVEGLKRSSRYLYKKSNEALKKSSATGDSELRRDSFMLEDLGKLALEVIPEVKQKKEADNI